MTVEPTGSSAVEQPRAFISYSWTSQEAADRIRLLAERLVSDGVDIVLDQWELREGQDKFAFMEKMVNDPTVTHVLALSDKRYAERADARDGGVGTETTILTPEVYERAGQQRVIPVHLELTDSGEPALPTFLRSRWGVDMSTPERENEGYEKLLRILFRKPMHVKPALGKAPSYLTSAAPARRSAAILHSLAAAVQRGSGSSYALSIDLLRQVTEDLHSLQFAKAPDAQTLLDEVTARMRETLPLRDDLIDLAALLAVHRTEERVTRALGDVLEAILAEQKSTPGSEFRMEQFDHYKLLAYEFLLATASLCMKHDRLDVLTGLCDRAYLAPMCFIDDYSGRPTSFRAFHGYIGTLDEHAGAHGAPRRPTSFVDLVSERATHSSVPFGELVGADILLFLRSLVTPSGDERWYPRLLSRARKAPEVLQRASHRQDFKKLTAFLHVESGDDLRAKVKDGAARLRVNEWGLGSPDSLLNLAALDTKI
jgi:hypothetical protein